MVHQEVEGVDLVVEIDGFGDLLRRDRHGIGDVREATRGECLRFGERRDGHAAKVEMGLDPCCLDALVGLDVGPQAYAEPSRLVGHAGGVAFELVEIDVADLDVEHMAGGQWEAFDLGVTSPGFEIFVYAVFACQHMYMRVNCAERGL